MYCAIYRSPRKADTYLYLVGKDRFDVVPKGLMKPFGAPQLVMELTLHPARKLAQADTRQVLTALLERGWFLQMPRQDVANTQPL